VGCQMSRGDITVESPVFPMCSVDQFEWRLETGDWSLTSA
jgi:hypothetical protein